MSGNRCGNTYNIQKKATEKINKYVDLQIECKSLRHKKVEVIPVIIGATGLVEKNLKIYLGRIPGHHDIHNLQRLANVCFTSLIFLHGNT